MTTAEMPVIPHQSQPKPPRKSRGKRILTWLLSFAVIGVFGAAGFLFWTDSKIDKIPVEEIQSLSPVTTETRNILIVGTDSRENLPEDFEGSFGDFEGSRTDVIMVAHFENGRAQLLSLPRDLRVEIPGNGINKINAAYVFGGPDLLVDTVQTNYNIPIHNYMEIDFLGFANTIDALGGIEMTFDFPGRDTKSGFEIDAGTHTLNGEQALAYARSRSYQELRDGNWVTVEGSDIGRTGRQQEILLTMLDQAASPGSAFNLPGFVSSFADQITADGGMSVSTMLDLGTNIVGLKGDKIEAITLPVDFLNDGGVSYVVPTSGAASVIDAFNAGDPLSTG